MPPPPTPVQAAGPSDRSPAAGGRDRLAVHLVWEGILAVVAIALAVTILSTEPSKAFSNVLAQAGYVGLVAVGLALSLRTGTPNLAVGSIAAFTGGLSADLMNEQKWSEATAMAVAVIVAIVIGAVIGLLVGALSVPAWAVTLGAALIVDMMLIALTGSIPIRGNLTDDYSTALWFSLFVVASLGGGLLWLVPGVRNALSATRRAGEPGRWGGLRPSVGAVVGITGSSLLAGLGGIAQLMRFRIAEPTSGEFLTTIGLAAVLLGGVSVFGRRAGVAGTALGVMVVVTSYNLFIIHSESRWAPTVLVGSLILVGLGVSRGLESITNALNAPRRLNRAQAPSPRP